MRPRMVSPRSPPLPRPVRPDRICSRRRAAVNRMSEMSRSADERVRRPKVARFDPRIDIHHKVSDARPTAGRFLTLIFCACKYEFPVGVRQRQLGDRAASGPRSESNEHETKNGFFLPRASVRARSLAHPISVRLSPNLSHDQHERRQRLLRLRLRLQLRRLRHHLSPPSPRDSLSNARSA